MRAPWTRGLAWTTTIALATATVAMAPMAAPMAATMVASMTAAGAAPTCEGRVATIVGTEGSDRLRGTPGDDVIVGLGGPDTIDAGDGDDLVCGGDGWDSLRGGAGDDRLLGGDHADSLEGGPGNDRLLGGRDNIARTVGDAWRAGDLLAGGPGNDLLDPGRDPRPTRARASDDHEVITFENSAGPVRIDLGLGNGRGRAVGEGTDTIVLVRKELRVIGSFHADVLEGSGRADYLVGLGGDDVIRGRGRGDVLIGDGAAEGGDARPPNADDVLEGGRGADVLASDGGADRMLGGHGADRLRSWSRDLRLAVGGPGADQIRTWVVAAGARVRGGGGSDELVLADTRPVTRIDAARGRVSGDDASEHYSVESIELWTVTWGTGYFTGSPRADHVQAVGRARLVATGRGGNDHLIGSRRVDDLDGGAGRDTLDGDPLRDRCVNGEAGTCLAAQ